MKTETAWAIRAWIYIGCAIIVAIFALWKYSYKISYEEQMLQNLRNINTHFWPPDVVPHPHLPEPGYPPHDEPKPPVLDIVRYA